MGAQVFGLTANSSNTSAALQKGYRLGYKGPQAKKTLGTSALR